MRIFICDIRGLLDLSGVELLEQERRQRMFRYRRPEDRARCLAAGLMLRSVLGKDAAASISASGFGKSFLPGGPCFNLSHSGHKVVLLVGEQAVGVDVEYIAPYPAEVAGRVFTAAEQRWLLQQGTDEAFFRLWTGKEAIMKALGLGFQLPPESFEIAPDACSPQSVCGRRWHLHWLEADGHMICTASERPCRPAGPILLTPEDLLKG